MASPRKIKASLYSVKMAELTKGLIGWSIEAPRFDDIRPFIHEVRKTRSGTVFKFKDGSKGSVDRGTAKFYPTGLWRKLE